MANKTGYIFFVFSWEEKINYTKKYYTLSVPVIAICIQNNVSKFHSDRPGSFLFGNHGKGKKKFCFTENVFGIFPHKLTVNSDSGL